MTTENSPTATTHFARFNLAGVKTRPTRRYKTVAIDHKSAATVAATSPHKALFCVSKASIRAKMIGHEYHFDLNLDWARDI